MDALAYGLTLDKPLWSGYNGTATFSLGEDTMTGNERAWLKLPEPPPTHPDAALLWEAEQALHGVATLADKPDIRNAFARRLEEFGFELEQSARRVWQTEHNIAFIGDIGVGKTTALCRAVGLEIPSGMLGESTSVLETGRGGTTICEVRIVNGTDYGLIVEPRTENELQREVREFAHFVTPSAEPRQEGETGSPRETGVSREVERAIRNMSGLIRERPRQSGGSRVPGTDRARVLAAELGDENKLATEIWNLIGIQNRTRRELWYSAAQSDQEPLRWLHDNFRRVNNGRHPEISLPQRIDVTMPSRILGEESLSIRIVDTKGIDGVAERGDLESHLNEPNTVTVLCSSFNDAPAVSVQQLLGRAVKADFPDLKTKSAILVLPHPGEAMGMKDDIGDPVDEAWQGYDFKRDQVELRLNSADLPISRTAFFNAIEDDVQELNDFLLGLVAVLREMHRERLEDVILGAIELVENYENEQARAVQRQAARRLTVWLENNQQVGQFSDPLSASLFLAIGGAYASSLRASVRRNGNWPNLEYEHHLGYGTRTMTAGVVLPKRDEFLAIATNLLQDPELEEAFQLVRQAYRIFESGTDGLLEAAESLGKDAYTEHMEPDAPFWVRCDGEWGQGPGYKNRVVNHHRAWFSAHQEIETRISQLVEGRWQQILDRVKAILADDEDDT